MGACVLCCLACDACGHMYVSVCFFPCTLFVWDVFVRVCVPSEFKWRVVCECSHVRVLSVCGGCCVVVDSAWVCGYVLDVLQYVGIKKSVFQLLVHLSKKGVFFVLRQEPCHAKSFHETKISSRQNFTRLPHLFNLVFQFILKRAFVLVRVCVRVYLECMWEGGFVRCETLLVVSYLVGCILSCGGVNVLGVGAGSAWVGLA